MKNLPTTIYATPNFDRRWQTKAIDDESVEYVRKDAFIEKAIDFIQRHTAEINYDYEMDREDWIEDFRKCMEE